MSGTIFLEDANNPLRRFVGSQKGLDGEGKSISRFRNRASGIKSVHGGGKWGVKLQKVFRTSD